MNKATFDNCLKSSDFNSLFIGELGWNAAQGQICLPQYEIDEYIFNIVVVAQRNGFQILKTDVNSIPSVSSARKLDSKLRRQANDYILIFTIPNSEHQCWMCPIKNMEKRELVMVEYSELKKADFMFSKIGSLSFDYDEVTTIIDVKERVQKAFAVNSEKITKDFYSGFRKEHKAFSDLIEGINQDKDCDWYTSVMLNRLMFCYFIQKKGFLNGDVDYLSNKLKEVKRQRGDNQFFRSFYLDFLLSLFHDGLNSPRHSDDWERRFGRIPYLNGGMFDVHILEKQYDNIDIPDEAFERLFDFFDKWQWHLDTRITASGKDINPDVLGYIFEQYINDRATMGAYYTKEDITEYIGKNCILPFLFDRMAESSSSADFAEDGFVWKFLQESGDTYIYDAVKKGYTSDWQTRIPQEIARGIDTTNGNLLERRADWNKSTCEEFALPTEIWRETIERLQRCDSVLHKINNGEIHHINDFITYNLNIRSFAIDLLNSTSDANFIADFYHSLQKVTILDPTCGSGAFLFAALNILEPLYETCIYKMQEINASHPSLFMDELNELNSKYRSNIQYFIYKSIILRNLYGVDIMVEATEIAKLRLFLKMVAVVEVDKRADNMGLDPLPDIDFNIRCGNTLVGYATKQELDDVLSFDSDILQIIANQEFKEKVNKECGEVADIYKEFKNLQVRQEENIVLFKQTKAKLSKNLASLNNLLNEFMFNSLGLKGNKDYSEWLNDTQPFHWMAEFYDIICGKGGFDVIIGNPPYVEYKKKDKQTGKSVADTYQIVGYSTENCSNLYAFCVERSYVLLNCTNRFGMIVPNSSISANKMLPLQRIICADKNSWITNYSWRPSKLFEGADMLLAIILTQSTNNDSAIYSSIYHKWYTEYRNCLFNNICYNNVTNILIQGSIPKIANNLTMSIADKFAKSSPKLLSSYFLENSSNKFYYFRAVQYWFKVLDKEPIYNEDGIHKITGEMKPIFTASKTYKNAMIAFLSSSTYFLYYILWSSCQVVNSRDFNIPINFEAIENIEFLDEIGQNLQKDYQRNSHIVTRNYSKKGREFTMEKQHFYIKYSKNIIDEIDKILARHYGFTEEELDFIINYDIKYRMGDELTNNEE